MALRFWVGPALLIFALAIVAVVTPADAMEPPTGPVMGPDGKPLMGPNGKPLSIGPDGKPVEMDKSEAKDGKNDKEAEKKEDKGPEPKVIRRDQLTPEPANAAELKKAVLGDDGKVAFEFRNQTWPELIEWLSGISGEPLDWQELPGDRVNITTPDRYNVTEVQDLINRHLLGRGYTMLKLNGGLTVVKCDALNPSLVPRVTERELSTLPPHTFVRASLDVGWLSAEKLATELKPMMSKNGVLTALTTTNRIEAMDAAVTLRHVAALLAEERDTTSREALAPEFKLRHLPAEEAKLMLEQFLGIEKKKETPMSPQEMQMMQQMRMQNGNQPPPEPKKAEIAVVANNRQNSIIIMAPPDRIVIAHEFLKRVDVPSATMASLADVKNRVQAFRLASLDPEKLVEIIQQMNILEPTTRTRVDAENRALIVSGSAADRYIIDQLIQRLDGSGRQFEVLQLRRLEAGEVAESIAFLMGQEKEEDDNSSNSRYSYFWGGNNQEEKKKKEDKFRVAANTRFRQVLLWANEQEMAEVRNLLIKLGELPPPGGDGRTVRSIEASPTPATYEYLKQLKQQFEQMGANPIELPEASAFPDPMEQQRAEEEAAAKQRPSGDNKSLPADVDDRKEEKKPKGNNRDAVSNTQNDLYRFAMLQQDDQEAPDSSLPKIQSAEEFDRFVQPKEDQAKLPEKSSGAPIRIQVDRAGNLQLSSRDTAALDRLESLMMEFSPPKRPYRVFKIKYASATWMRLNLEDYFKDLDDNKESEGDSFFRWYFGGGDDNKKKEPTGLGKGKKLRFVDDIDTNTIVVNGADAEQLATIEELIELWDVPEPVSKRKTRFTRLLPVQYGKAEKIAGTVKDAYRDLLSSNDKAFQVPGQGDETAGGRNARQTPRNRGGSGSDLVDTNGDRESGGSDFTFKGKLSVGVDEVGNTLLVSAEGEPLLNLVCDMIRQLDMASRPSGDVQVAKLSGQLSPQTLEAALRAFGSKRGESGNKESPDPPQKDESAK